MGLKHLGVDPTAPWGDVLVEEAASAFTLLYPEFKSPNMWVNCNPFFYPKCPENHCGEHSRFICGLVAHERFRAWLASFKCKFLEKQANLDVNDEDEYEDELVIALCCRAGINRSIGLCAIVAHILEAEGHKVSKAWLSQDEMQDRGICMNCVCCKSGEQAMKNKIRAFDYAVAVYRQSCG